MINQLVFIDDSGDPGFKRASSSNFVMAAALFMNPKTASELSSYISKFRKELGWRNDYEFKFTKIRKDIIANLLDGVSKFDFSIYAVYIDKRTFGSLGTIIDNDKLYNWAIKELLVSMPLKDAKIEIDGRSSKRYMQNMKTYIRRSFRKKSCGRLDIKFEDSSKDNLIQLTDLIAGSINRSMTDKTDSMKYINIFSEKIVKIKKLT